MRIESQDSTYAVIDIAFVIAVDEPSADLSQIVHSDVFTAPRTKGGAHSASCRSPKGMSCGSPQGETEHCV
jgi:hypothetical protein